MSKINIFAMGGLNENGKNSYVVEVDNDIFVFDLGIKFAPESMLGVDYIIPDFDYLVKNKNKIKGIFITNALPESSGGVLDIIKMIKDVKIYVTKYVYNILILKGVPKESLIVMNLHKRINFGNDLSVFPIRVNNSNPDSAMLVLNTKDGAICYTSNFLIDSSMMDSYHMDLGKIAYVGKKGVLAMLCETSFAEKEGFSTPNHHLVSSFKKTIKKAEERVIFSVLRDHLYTIEGIFAAAKAFNKKVIVADDKLNQIINMAIDNKYMQIEKKQIGSKSDIKDKKSIILISDDRNTPYKLVNEILNGKNKDIKFNEKDTVYFAEPKYDEYEKTYINTLNKLSIEGITTEAIPSGKQVLQHASSEDIMVMTSLLNPKYFIPVRGEYRYMVAAKDIATDLGYNEKNILLKLNGEYVSINNGTLSEKSKKIKIEDILIDGSSTQDIGNLVLKDREVLSENGIVLINASLDKKTKKIIAGPEVTTRGFIYIKNSHELMNEIKDISVKVIEKNVYPKYIDFANIRSEIREKLGKYFYKETESKPMIIAVIQEV